MTVTIYMPSISVIRIKYYITTTMRITNLKITCLVIDNTANGNNCGISFNGDGIRPTNGSGTEVNNEKDLGHASYRWRNIYTNDLNLYNEGHGNDVDGTWGSYTIQEGADDLFLINKRNGKKYKFNLTEVS